MALSAADKTALKYYIQDKFDSIQQGQITFDQIAEFMAQSDADIVTALKAWAAAKIPEVQAKADRFTGQATKYQNIVTLLTNYTA